MDHQNDKVRILDLSGYTYSGKSAFSDFFRGVDTFSVPGNEVEFDLVRIKNGLLDLKDALTTSSWSLIRSSNAIADFKSVNKKLCGGMRLLDRLFTPGTHLEKNYPGIKSASYDLVSKVVQGKQLGDWPFYDPNCGGLTILIRKLRRKLGFKLNDKIYISRLRLDEFDNLVNETIGECIKTDIYNKHTYKVINNAFETSDPMKSLTMFPGSKSIIVDRDPRDIYKRN
ncbi:hypothetical protein N9D09_01195 [bacterium]|nr:hypothetical protein [bacterium]